MKRVRETQDVYCVSGRWLCRAALGVLLLSCTHALAIDDSSTCPDANSSRVALHLPRGGGFCLPEIAEAAPASAGLEVALTAFGYDCCEDFRASVPTLEESCLNAMCETMSSIIQFFGEE